jgi:VCBS repeat-containing protein
MATGLGTLTLISRQGYRLSMDATRRITSAADVVEDSTVLFTVRDADGTQQEALLVRTGDGIRAWMNHCQHWTDVRLDRGDGALVRAGELVCQKHGATFVAETGYCNFGPCEGAVLDAVEVEVTDGAVYLVDDEFEYHGLGPADRDDDEGGSRIDFTGT